METSPKTRTIFPHAQRYLVAGALTLIPLWVTWVTLNFLLSLFSNFGRPWVQGFARAIQGSLPRLAKVLLHPWFESLLAIVFTLLVLYALGWATTRVLGRRVLAYFESLLDRIPLVKAIYGSVKKLVTAFQVKPDGLQRVVLIDFPSREMKAVGFVTRTVLDRHTSKELAMVYVPTTPNPTSGYMEIVPVERLTPTDWTLEEAMRLIITGGASAPDSIVYQGKVGEEQKGGTDDPGSASHETRAQERPEAEGAS
jgi:uncharacterized membrane protein